MLLLKKFFADDSGATAVEYALIGTLVSLAIISGMTLVYGNVGNTFNGVSNTIEAAHNQNTPN